MAAMKLKPHKTLEDYMSLPDGTRAELIAGELFMSPSPTAKHQRIVQRLFLLLSEYVARKRFGEVFVSPLDVHLPSGDIVQPDLILVAASRSEIVSDWIRGAPDLLIEVLSPQGAERDQIVKRDLYARNGVREYWIVDGEAESIEILTVAKQSFESHGYFEMADTATSIVLADIELVVRDVFA